MAPEESTVRLYHRLEEGMGKDTATVLAEHLETLATKKDLDDMVATLATKAELTAGLADVKASMYRAVLATALVLVSTNVAVLGTAVTVFR